MILTINENILLSKKWIYEYCTNIINDIDLNKIYNTKIKVFVWNIIEYNLCE
jgi:hypothetical protein